MVILQQLHLWGLEFISLMCEKRLPFSDAKVHWDGFPFSVPPQPEQNQFTCCALICEQLHH